MNFKTTASRFMVLTSALLLAAFVDAPTAVEPPGSAALSRGASGDRVADLFVYITGWTDVNSSPSCRLQYVANVEGGAGGNTFTWETSGIIHDNWGDVVYASFPTEGGNWISVVVTDVTGAQEGQVLEIQSSASELECYG
jgi:hypothetical protein